jgi:hypothetical protein
MVPSFFTGFLVNPPVFLGKNSLPTPIGRSIRVLSVEYARQEYSTPTF